LALRRAFQAKREQIKALIRKLGDVAVR